jgi:hypothetical protein
MAFERDSQARKEREMRSRFLQILIAGALLAATTNPVSASAQSLPVIFQGLEHSAVGGATLQVTPDGSALEVTTFDPGGADGVAVALGQAVTWTARLGSSGARPMNLSFHAMADGRRISSASLIDRGRRFQIQTLFTGATTPTYTATVYRSGRLVGAVGGLPPTAQIWVPESFCDTFGSIGFIACDFVSDFRNSASGECEWRFAWRTVVAIQLPNGAKLAGNEVRLTEEVRAPGHYPYLSFDGMVVRTSARSLTFLSESVR